MDKFKNPTSLRTGSGVEIAYNDISIGSVFTADMLSVPDYDLKDWSVVFTPNITQKMSLSLGYKAVVAATNSNQIAVGNLVNADGDDSIQIGRSDHNFLMYREPAIRNDEEDKASISDSTLGLDFINALKPKKFKYSFRDEALEAKYPLPHPVTKPDEPLPSTYNTLDIDGNPDYDQVGFDAAMAEYNRKKASYDAFVVNLKKAMDGRKNDFGSIKGTSVDTRFTFGFVSKEVVEASTDPDFNPTHKPKNGKGATYFYPVQLIAPMVTSIQELHKLAVEQRKDHNDLEVYVGLEITAIKLGMADIEETIRKMKGENDQNQEDNDQNQAENELNFKSIAETLEALKERLAALEDMLTGGDGGEGEEVPLGIGSLENPFTIRGKPISLEAPDGTKYTASIAQGGFFPTASAGAHLGNNSTEETKWRTLHLRGNTYNTFDYRNALGGEYLNDNHHSLALDLAKEVRFISSFDSDGLVCGITADAVEAMLTYRGFTPSEYGLFKQNSGAESGGGRYYGVNLTSIAILIATAALLKK